MQVHVSFLPSSNIYEGDTAVYYCSSNHSSVTTHWFLNLTLPSTDPSFIKLGIVTGGIGTTTSNLTIPGLPQLNNTLVTCYASGPLTGLIAKKNSILLIQGEMFYKLSTIYFHKSIRQTK